MYALVGGASPAAVRASIMGGLVITEQVFGVNGMGRYFLQSFSDAEYVNILPWMMIVVFSVIVFSNFGCALLMDGFAVE